MDVICLGSYADQTFAYTVERFCANDLNVVVIDLARMAKDGRIEIDREHPSQSGLSIGDDFVYLGEAPLYARLVDISNQAPTEALGVAARRQIHALTLLLNSLEQVVIGRPRSNVSNYSKLIQLVVLKARDVFLPASIVTTRPFDALGFIEEHEGRVIYKGVSSRKTSVTRWKSEDRKRLLLSKGTPVLFQREIVGFDVRAHVVGQDIICELIRSDDVDYRYADKRKNTYVQIETPSILREACLSIQQMTGDLFLGIDFRMEMQTGRWYLLEANNMPAYVGYDKRTNRAISDALIRLIRTA
jgi:glutathione synthase/RimK-type ligase-like ATP-grasp enzyme